MYPYAQRETKGFYVMSDGLEYDEFYRRANGSEAFSRYCEETFGVDLTQDGFTDRDQLDYLINFVHMNAKDIGIDVGCGNGRTANYVAGKTGAAMFGLDKSRVAIDFARERYGKASDWSVGDINEIDLEPGKFTVALFLDSLYFSDDIRATLERAYSGLREGGRIGIMHSDFRLNVDARPDKTVSTNADIARVIRQNGWRSNFVDFTDQHFRVMKRKNAACQRNRPLFEGERNLCLYDRIAAESVGEETCRGDFDSFSNRYAFCIYK